MSQLEFKSYIAVTVMKMNEPTFEDNIQGKNIRGPSDQVNFPSKSNYGRPSKAHYLWKFDLIILVT